MISKTNNTRFAPSPISPMHIGHVWMAYVNYMIAKQNDGAFIVRFETETSKWALPTCTDFSINKLCNDYIDILTWMGMKPDLIVWEENELRMFKEFRDKYWPKCEKFVDFYGHYNNQGVYKARINETAYRVYSDYNNACNPVVRGNEVVLEHFLYIYLCELAELPIPELYYIPRITANNGVVAQTLGNFSVEQFKNIYTPEEIIVKLRKACMMEPEGEVNTKKLILNPNVWIGTREYYIRFEDNPIQDGTQWAVIEKTYNTETIIEYHPTKENAEKSAAEYNAKKIPYLDS